MLIFPDLILPHLLVILYLVYFDDGYTDVPARDIFYTDNPANFYLFTNICILIIQNPNTFKKYWQRLTFILDVSVHLHVDFTLNFLLFLL